MNELYAVIMAGGAGTRFWPASRRSAPKQLLPLAGERTMIQDTAQRLDGLLPPERTLVVTNEALVAPIRGQLPLLPPGNVVGEPCKRDTAPCVGLAAALVEHAAGGPATMLVMPADHVIRPPQRFQSAVRQAVKMVEQSAGRIVTFGIPPAYPAETFGYIERGEPLDAEGHYRVVRFREKPDADTARGFLAAGDFYWNSGIFVWSTRTILDALAQHEPAMHARLATIAAAIGTDDYDAVLQREFTAIEGKSIDYAVMERHDDVVVIEAPFEWDDLGGWPAMARLRGTDDAGNTAVGKHVGIETKNTIISGSDDHLIVTLGLENCIVVHTPDATLVAHRDHEESIRKVVEELKSRGEGEYL